jgi:hypothetical protein
VQILTIRLRSKARVDVAEQLEPDQELDYPGLVNKVLPDDVQVRISGMDV